MEQQNQPQEETDYVEGRLGLGEGAQRVLYLVLFAAFIFTTNSYRIVIAANHRMCVPGWGGYSLGSEIYWARDVFVVMVMVIFGVWGLVFGWRERRRQRNVPIGYRPWFRTRLLEGQAAVREGTWLMVTGAISFLVAFAVANPSWSRERQNYPLSPPSAMAQCQQSSPNKAESVDPASVKPQP
ncbi:MAG: hypothetical protein FWC42_06865 [Proteobacteria bacterium]|nr:hypothetical protein [Pseudomonadota bacterium]